MRPRSIIQYEFIFWASIALGLLSNVIGWRYMRQAFAGATLPPGAPTPAMMSGIVVGGALIGLAISLTLLWLTARKGSDIARIVVSIFFAIGVLMAVRGMFAAGQPALFAGLALVQALLQIGMIYLLWVPADAKAWFRGRGPAA